MTEWTLVRGTVQWKFGFYSPTEITESHYNITYLYKE